MHDGTYEQGGDVCYIRYCHNKLSCARMKRTRGKISTKCNIGPLSIKRKDG